MTTYYVDAQGGDDVENGLTWATAFQTLAQLSSVMVSGDSGLLSGVFSGEVLTLVDFANITLGTVGGQPSPFLYTTPFPSLIQCLRFYTSSYLQVSPTQLCPPLFSQKAQNPRVTLQKFSLPKG